MPERRFDEGEVAEIFRRATEAQQTGGVRAPLASREGMTLGALQEIGREVGIHPEQIARAARAIAPHGEAGTTRFLGLPLGVRRVVELDRRISDSEWDSLVVELRQVFDAKGRMEQSGSFRQWTNGNLQVLLEPSEGGSSHRLRLRTLNGRARAFMIVGLAMTGMAALSALGGVSGGVGLGELLSRVGSLALMGAGLFAAGAVILPSWARTRRRQMDEIAARISASTGDPD